MDACVCHCWKSVGKPSEPTDEEVPETLDPSELWHIRESLEKYTTALMEGEDASGLGLGSGAPSLAEGEMDDAVDSSVGQSFQVTWLGADGSVPPWAAGQRDGLAYSLLSAPLPGYPIDQQSLVVKSDIDGLLFTLPGNDETKTPLSWKHTSTFPVLAFVLASKRDTRFTHHISSKLVLAFESGSGFGSGNVYMYHKPSESEKNAKQSVLKVSGGASGSLLGVGAVQMGSGSALLCLCEKELVIMKGILE